MNTAREILLKDMKVYQEMSADEILYEEPHDPDEEIDPDERLEKEHIDVKFLCNTPHDIESVIITLAY